MKMIRLTTKALQGLFALSLFGMVSCVDNDYDLSKDIDMSITIGGDLAIPGSNTDNITLEKIFDLDEESVIKTNANGDYVLKQNGSGDPSTVKIEKVVVRNIESQGSSIELEFDKRLIQDDEILANVENLKMDFSIDKDDITQDIVSLKSAKVNMKVDFQLFFEGQNNIENLTLKNGFSIAIPECLTVTVGSAGYAIENNKIVFKGDKRVGSSGLHIILNISHIDFTKLPNGQGLVQPGHLIIKQAFVANGKAVLLATDFPDETNTVNLNMKTQAEIGDLTINEVTGKVDPKINIEVSPVTINDLPDFLLDESVILDVENPQIQLTVKNSTPVEVDINAQLIAKRKNGETKTVNVGKKYGTAPITIDANKTTVITLSRLGIGGSGKNIKIENLNDLIKQIPEEIVMDNIEAKAASNEYTIALGSNYAVETNYLVQAPLSFGTDLNIAYRDTLDGWHGDIEDYEFKEALVTLKAVNGIPLGMKMEVDAIDAQGNVMQGVKAVVTGAITPGKTNAEQTSNLSIKLTAESGVLKNLDGLILKVDAKTDETYKHINLNKGQSLKLTDIRFKIIGGIKVDWN